MRTVQQMEVDWYRQHGRYPERIVMDSHGNEYVIGDWCWHTMMGKPLERIETTMRYRLPLEVDDVRRG